MMTPAAAQSGPEVEPSIWDVVDVGLRGILAEAISLDCPDAIAMVLTAPHSGETQLLCDG